MSEQMPWNPWVAQNWSSSSYGWQNILDIKKLGWKGIKFENQQYYLICAIMRIVQYSGLKMS